MIDRIWILLLFPGLPLLGMVWLFRRLKADRAHLKRPFFSFRRPAGHSLQEKVEKQWEALQLHIVGFVVSAMIPALIYYLNVPLNLVSVVILLLLSGYFLHRVRKALPPYQNSRLGLLGEQITGAELDALQSDEVSTYHDLVFRKDGRTWNIDHVLLTPKGVILFETKTRSINRVKGKFPHKLTYNGERIVFPNGAFDTEAIDQVQRNANDLRADIAAWTGGENVPVHSVLVYPGWTITRTGRGTVSVMSHDKLGQLLPLQGEPIDSKTLFILKNNLDRESRVILDDETKGSGVPTRGNGHHRRPLVGKRQCATSAMSAGANVSTGR